MSVDQPILETFSQQVNLEECADPDVTAEQITALQESDIEITKGAVRIAGAVARFTHLKHPNPQDAVKRLISNGYLASDGAYKPFAINMALQGHDVVLIKPPRHQQLRKQLSLPHLRDVLRVQAQAQYGVMKYLGDDQYDLYGHSMGFDIDARVAEEKPEKVRSMVGAGGAGINGPNSFLGMLVNGVRLVKRDIRRSLPEMRQHAEPGLAFEEVVHILGSPLRSGREGVTVARANNITRLEQAADSGIRLGCILFEEDGCFTVDSVMRASHHIFDELIVTPNANHMYPQDHPNQHAQDVTGMFADLNSPKVKLSA